MTKPKVAYKVEIWGPPIAGKKGPNITNVATYYIDRIAIKRADVERDKLEAKGIDATVHVLACTPKHTGMGFNYISCEQHYRAATSAAEARWAASPHNPANKVKP